MRLLRSLLAAFFFVGFALGSVILGFLLFPVLAVCGDGAWARRWMRRLVRVTYRLFVGVGRVTGLFRVDLAPEDRKRLAAAKGCVVVANHLTLIDIIILIAHMGDTTAIAKSAAARNPFYSRIVRSAFLVNDDPEGVLREAGDLLAAGTNLVVFPEGTRTPTETRHRRLRRGAAQIALAAEVPVLPIRITCDPPVLAKGQPWYEVGARTIVYTLATETPILPRSPVEGRHAAAVALTAEIGAALFGPTAN
ncbi:MAG: 1-acyl-sn-glycerol-3-phosphate acyltransferase [Kiritimatiellae bacterium]|nr:1-acyl-sn-glycerol-3-phosphate acyltransferase [Kiritimatiellia bacterium]